MPTPKELQKQLEISTGYLSELYTRIAKPPPSPKGQFHVKENRTTTYFNGIKPRPPTVAKKLSTPSRPSSQGHQYVRITGGKHTGGITRRYKKHGKTRRLKTPRKTHRRR
jgi:hypothetical protein